MTVFDHEVSAAWPPCTASARPHMGAVREWLRAISRARTTDRLDRVLVYFTFGRLILIPVVIATFAVRPIVTAAALLAFILADIYDGVLARRRDADGPSRRALDSVVDRWAIHAVFITATVAGYFPVSLLAVLLVRDAYCAYWCYRIMRDRYVAICADWLYRGLNLLFAGWVIMAPYAGDDLRTRAGIFILALAGVVAVDLTRAARRVLAMPANVRQVAIPAGSLRFSRRASTLPY